MLLPRASNALASPRSAFCASNGMRCATSADLFRRRRHGRSAVREVSVSSRRAAEARHDQRQQHRLIH